MPVAAATPPTVVEWLGLRVELDQPWELVRHSLSARKGSLVFADRYRQRLQVLWTACVKRPDIDRLLADHRAKQSEGVPEDASDAWRDAEIPAGWKGLIHDQPDAPPLLRAARFDPATSRLLEAILPLPVREDDPGDAFGGRLLQGLRIVLPPSEARRLRAFGVSIDCPAGWRPTSSRVMPADVQFTFAPADAADDRRVTLRRRAMADVWFDGELKPLLQAEAGKRVKVEFRPGPAGAVEGRWDLPGPRYRRLLGRHRVGLARVWHDPRQHAVFEMRAEGPAPDPPPLTGFTLRRDEQTHKDPDA